MAEMQSSVFSQWARPQAVGLALTAILASGVVQADVYPTRAEAVEKGYQWLHPRVLRAINRHAGWAIDDLGAKPRLLPPGVLAQHSFTPGWATFGLALPQGAASDGVSVGRLATQTDVKTRWPDGSVRFCVVTAFVPTGGRQDIRPGVASVGTFLPRPPERLSVALTLLPASVTYTAELPVAPTTDLWLTGPLATEWRHEAAPADSSGDPHPFLRVVGDYRTYRDGAARWDLTVENALDIRGATSVEYSVEVRDHEQILFEQPAVTHPYLTRWRKLFGFHLEEARLTPDFESFHLTGALPRYLGSVDDERPDTSGPHYEPLGRGGNSHDRMPAPGGRGELAPYPDHTARYIVHKTESQRNYVLKNGDLAGSWPVHIREADGTFVSLDRRPDFWLDPRGMDKPAGDLGARGPLVPDNAHVPSWAYVPYLLTGDRYYADEMAFWANFALLSTSNYERQRGANGEGYLGANNQVRGFAWGLRNMVDAAAYLPAEHPLKTYLRRRVENNLAWADDYARSFETMATGVVFLRTRRRGSRTVIAQWEHNYLAWALDHANRQGFQGGRELLLRLTGFQSRLFTSEPDFAREYGAPYLLAIGDRLRHGELRYYATMSELFDKNSRTDAGEREPPVPLDRDYAASARLVLMIHARIADRPQLASDGG